MEAIDLNRKFGAMGHPSRGTGPCRILSFTLERAPQVACQFRQSLGFAQDYKERVILQGESDCLEPGKDSAVDSRLGNGVGTP